MGLEALGAMIQQTDYGTLLERAEKMSALRHRYADATTMAERWEAIRAVYRYYTPAIMRASAWWHRGIDPYFVDWQFTPIETVAWNSIRGRGIPLYPQVPVDRFFVDFANPYHRIGVELDGQAYHEVPKDRQRDAILAKQGWRVFRIPGRKTPSVDYFLPIELETQQLTEGEWRPHISHWLYDTCDGILAAISGVFFRPDNTIWQFQDIALASLNMHQLVKTIPLPDYPLKPVWVEEEPEGDLDDC